MAAKDRMKDLVSQISQTNAGPWKVGEPSRCPTGLGEGLGSGVGRTRTGKQCGGSTHYWFQHQINLRNVGSNSFTDGRPLERLCLKQILICRLIAGKVPYCLVHTITCGGPVHGLRLFGMLLLMKFRKIRNQPLDRTPQLAMMNLFMNQNKGPDGDNKCIAYYLLMAAHLTFAKHWENLQGFDSLLVSEGVVHSTHRETPT